MSPVVRRVATPRERADLAEGVRALERGVRYPFGDDRFELDHGADPFAFFARLGEAVHFVALEGERVVGALAAVLRSVPAPGGGTREAWYLGDLKARAGRDGPPLARTLFDAARTLESRCPRAYAISMDPPGGAPNRVVRALERARTGLVRVDVLELFSLDADQVQRVRGAVEAERGPLAFESLAGVKDLVLESTGAPLPLLHARYGRGGLAPERGAVHLFAAPSRDGLARTLRAAGHAPSATASLLARGLHDQDFAFVLSSEL